MIEHHRLCTLSSPTPPIHYLVTMQSRDTARSRTPWFSAGILHPGTEGTHYTSLYFLTSISHRLYLSILSYSYSLSVCVTLILSLCV